MQLLVISDIFGHTPALDLLAQTLSPSARIIDPYNGKKYALDNEDDAYQCFSTQCGHDAYKKLISQVLADVSEPTRIVAFSAGAVAVWRALGETANSQLVSMTGFYPGQIRHYLAVEPSVDCHFIFPGEEPHFDIVPVVEELNKKSSVNCEITPYLHGFMNAVSGNFNARGYQQFIESLQSDI